MLNGYRRDLNSDDVSNIDDSEKCTDLTKELEKEWSKLCYK